MSTVEVVIRLHKVEGDAEDVQDLVMDILYAGGFNRIEPIRTTLMDDCESDDYRGC
jgi:hypothetical protein